MMASSAGIGSYGSMVDTVPQLLDGLEWTIQMDRLGVPPFKEPKATAGNAGNHWKCSM
jgi:hypothetical protein